MDYDKAVQAYVGLRTENKRIEDEAAAQVAANKDKMEKLAAWLQLKAEKDGLEKIPTKYGTVFWTEGDRCSVSNGEAYFAFVRQHDAWELLEKRASKVGVRDWIKTHGQVPPGVDYTTLKQINVRSK